MKRTILSGSTNSRGGARRKRLAPKGARLFHSGWLYGLTSISLSLIHRGIIIRPLSLSPLIAYTTCTHTLSLSFSTLPTVSVRPWLLLSLKQLLHRSPTFCSVNLSRQKRFLSPNILSIELLYRQKGWQNLYVLYQLYWKDENKEKEVGMAHF